MTRNDLESHLNFSDYHASGQQRCDTNTWKCYQQAFKSYVSEVTCSHIRW